MMKGLIMYTTELIPGMMNDSPTAIKGVTNPRTHIPQQKRKNG